MRWDSSSTNNFLLIKLKSEYSTPDYCSQIGDDFVKIFSSLAVIRIHRVIIIQNLRCKNRCTFLEKIKLIWNTRVNSCSWDFTAVLNGLLFVFLESAKKKTFFNFVIQKIFCWTYDCLELDCIETHLIYVCREIEMNFFFK